MRDYKVVTDLVQPRFINPIVYKQYDNGDNLEIELYENGEKIVLSTETVLAFFELMDGTVIEKTCNIVGGNAIATLDNNILSQSGHLVVEFTIYKDGEETTTRSLTLTVEKSINRNEAITTLPQWDIVQQILTFDLEGNKAAISKAVSDAQEATTNANNTITALTNENKVIWLSPVAKFADIATTYPNALDGSQVLTTDDAAGIQNQYRKINGSWLWTGRYRDNALIELMNRLNDANRQTANLPHGMSILQAAQNSLVEVEIQGRTLTSLGNSNLEGSKYYVLADKKTKLRAEGREGTLISGVAKFTKSASLITKADFTGKVTNSTNENAHIASATTNAILQAPNGTWVTPDDSTFNYLQMSSLNGAVRTVTTSVNGQYAQAKYSFNIIEQIERKMGRIPADTVAGKVQWIKDNVFRLVANHHGWGSSVGGNKLTWARWGGSWVTITSHTNGTVTKTNAIDLSSVLSSLVQSDGFVHFLAYAEPSDGITPSQLNTDFIDLEIELKSTAVLDTRPILTRVANFEGKQQADLVSVPHTAHATSFNTLAAPSVNWGNDLSTASYALLSSLNGQVYTNTVNANGYYAEQKFSWDLIAEVERNIGRIPKATTTEKVQWLKDNVQSLEGIWNGFGSSVGGNKASFARWSVLAGIWSFTQTHSVGSVTKLSMVESANVQHCIDSNGFYHLLAYAEPSDGNVASTINTDYVELQITLKQGATLHDPLVPLYEVDSADYTNILVAWDETNVLQRYPKVQGVQHLQNVAVIAEGENLLPPFTEGWTVHANAKVLSPYELELNATSTFNSTSITINVIPNRDYYLDLPTNGNLRLYDGGTLIFGANTTNQSFTFRPTKDKLEMSITNATTTGKFTWTNPMLTLGTTKKPFVPRNPSYLFAQTKLGQIGDKKDILLKQDGVWYKRKLVELDVVLDGSLAWSQVTNYTGYKSARVTLTRNWNGLNGVGTKYNGELLKFQTDFTAFGNTPNSLWLHGSSDLVYLTVLNTETGFTDGVIPTSDEWKAFFNGWQAKTVDANGKPTAWRSLGDGTDAPTQTLDYVKANKAPNYSPYRLSYVLSSPQLININHLVEGDIAVSGATQVEVTSGVVVREKIVPKVDNLDALYTINSLTLGRYKDTKLVNKASKILSVNKNSLLDKGWRFTYESGVSNGLQHALLDKKDFDPTAEYTVTYLVLDRHLFTNNATEVKAAWAGSIKDQTDMNTDKISDLAAGQSVLNMQMYKVMVALKGASINV